MYIFDLIEGGIIGAIASKIYDFIFEEEDSDKKLGNIKEKDEKKNSKENSNKNIVDTANDGEKKWRRFL